MVTIVRGTKRSHNGTLKIAAAIASMSAYDLHRKTLILQIANNLSDISYELAGYVSSEEDSYGFEENANETGIDALLARAATGSITESQFDALVTPISKERHELDVATRSNTENKIEYTVAENIQAFNQILLSAAGDTEADAPYDNVIVVANGKNEELLSMIRPYIDNEVICVGQNTSELKNEEKEKSGIKRIVVVNDFSEESVYNLRFMKKEYKTQNVYPMPHNILLSDATNSGRINSYISGNLKVDVSNVNYAVIDSLRNINNVLFMEKPQERTDTLKGIKGLPKKKNARERIKLYPLPDGSVTVAETEVKKFLKKPYIERNIELDTENLVDVEDEFEYEDFGVTETYLEDREEDEKRAEKRSKQKKAAKKNGDDMRKEQKDHLRQAQLEMENKKKNKNKKKGFFGLFGKKNKPKLDEAFDEDAPEEEFIEDEEYMETEDAFDEREEEAYLRDAEFDEDNQGESDVESEDETLEDIFDNTPDEYEEEEISEDADSFEEPIEESFEEPVEEQPIEESIEDQEEDQAIEEFKELNLDLVEDAADNNAIILGKADGRHAIEPDLTRKIHEGKLRADDLLDSMLKG